MLVLRRARGQSFLLKGEGWPKAVEIVVSDLDKTGVCIGIDADKTVRICRSEIAKNYEAFRKDKSDDQH